MHHWNLFSVSIVRLGQKKKKKMFYFILSGSPPRGPAATPNQRQGEGSWPHAAPAATSLDVDSLSKEVRRKFISGWISRCNNSLAGHKLVNVLRDSHCLWGWKGGWRLQSCLACCQTALLWRKVETVILWLVPTCCIFSLYALVAGALAGCGSNSRRWTSTGQLPKFLSAAETEKKGEKTQNEMRILKGWSALQSQRVSLDK